MNRNKLTQEMIDAGLPPGKHCDGAGLWLVVRPGGGAQWVLRVTVNGKRREMGLGGVDYMPLDEARAAAKSYRTIAKRGGDPIQVRNMS